MSPARARPRRRSPGPEGASAEPGFRGDGASRVDIWCWVASHPSAHAIRRASGGHEIACLARDTVPEWPYAPPGNTDDSTTYGRTATQVTPRQWRDVAGCHEWIGCCSPPARGEPVAAADEVAQPRCLCVTGNCRQLRVNLSPQRVRTLPEGILCAGCELPFTPTMSHHFLTARCRVGDVRVKKDGRRKSGARVTAVIAAIRKY